MIHIYGNYKGDYQIPRLCPHCHQEDDTTEHLISCTALGTSNLSPEDLLNDDNCELWMQINERVTVNMKSS